MTDQELRALVRDAVARHLGPRADAEAPMPPQAVRQSSDRGDMSHAVYLLVNTGDECVIEPSVRCNHCNYCRSHGH